mgnify:CR=1 FL=1
MYDVMILGGGPAGYVAAEHAGAMGKKVLLVDSAESGGGMGGVCLNSGCIPTKCMLAAAKTYHHAKHGAPYGVTASNITFDYSVAKKRTEAIQEKLRGGIGALMKAGKVDVVKARGTIAGKGKIVADGKTYEGANILICTGSRPFFPPIPSLKEKTLVLTNENILKLDKKPQHLINIGGGVIGTEYACLYSTVGKKVTVIEMLPKLCGPVDKELAKTVQRSLEENGATIHLGATVTKVDGGTVTFNDKSGAAQTITADGILVATGRAVNLQGIGLESAGIDFDKRGIKVDDQGRTNVPGIWAAGDVTGRWQLAHYASRQSTVAVHAMFGGTERVRETAIPSVVYTNPEIACVGLTEEQATERGIKVKTAKFPMTNNGRYLAETEGERGVVKVIADATHGTVLGMHMVGHGVSEMIATAVLMVEMELRAKDVLEMVFPHPAICETMHDVMLGIH